MEFLTVIGVVAVFAAGYVASIYTWQWVLSARNRWRG